MIEILIGVYYDPSKSWYEQDPVLIELAETVMLEAPTGSEMETSGANERMLWGEWVHITALGTFKMRVDFHWLYSIEHRAFLTKKRQESVTVEKLA